MRLGFFPTPHPDELLYSLCARFSAHAKYSTAKGVMEQIFGTNGATATIDLPNNLGHLSAALPTGSSLTVKRLINRHTLLPFYSAFLPPKRVVQIEGDMRSGRGQASYMRSGVMASRIPTIGYLRFCPICIQEDKRQLRETYWRRTHQIPGVEICLVHGVFLQESSVGRTTRRDNLQFIIADEAAQAMRPRRIDFSDRDHQVLLQVAHDVAWLLKHPNPGSEPRALHNRYLKLLSNRGLATYSGSIHVTTLLGEFMRYYSRDLLQLLHCQFTGSDHTKNNWLLRLVRPPKHSQHPLYHLLLIRFLGCTVEEFFQMPEELDLFGKGPWPCLNPAANHFREPVIQEYMTSSRLRDNHPVAKFSCECGFAYARSGPDSSPEDRFRIGRMISFGSVWEAKLKELWKESSLSLSEIGRRLGVDPLTVRRHAAQMKLPFSGVGGRSKPLKRAAQLKSEILMAAWEKMLRTHRSKWLSAMRQNPKITMKSLRRRYPQGYAWMLQNDSDWLKKHSPQSQKHVRPISSVDWKGRDAEYVIAVRDAASRLRNGSGRPIQITKTAIGRAIGAATILQQKYSKMPLTTQVIASVVETRVEYAVRRIRWTAKCFLLERNMPRHWQLVLRANAYSLKDVPEVKSAIDAAVSLLESSLSFKKKLTT